MEKVIFENRSGNNLAGILQKSNEKPSKYVVMLHGFTGNKDEKGLFVEAAHYLHGKGFSVFRFDVRGSGDSEGDFSEVGIKEEKEDFLCAIDYLKEHEGITDRDIFVIGFSLGATVAVLGHHRYFKSMAFWSPAFFPERDMYPRYLTEEINAEFAQNGYFIKSGLKVGKKIINDFRDCNLVSHLEKLDVPTLVVHGEKDDKISFQSSEIGVRLLNRYGNFELIPKACHSFRTPNGIRSKLFEMTSSFFSNSINS